MKELGMIGTKPGSLLIVMCCLVPVTLRADDDSEKAVKAAERTAKLFFAARDPKKIYRIENRSQEGEKEVKVKKKVGRRWTEVIERRKTTEWFYFKTVNRDAVRKSWDRFLIPAVREQIDMDNIADLVAVDTNVEARLLRAVDLATRRGNIYGDSRDYVAEARAAYDAYMATTWPLAYDDVKHLRTVCSRSSITMWHRVTEVRIPSVTIHDKLEDREVPYESQDKKDDKLLKNLPSTELMTVWVRLAGEFYLSAAIEVVATRQGQALIMRSMEGEVLRRGPGMTADELAAQAYDGVSGNVELGACSDTGELHSIRAAGDQFIAEIRVGTHTIWAYVAAGEDIARLKRLRIGSEVTFHGKGAITTENGIRYAVVRETTIQ